ncbi:hypothetical protein SALBM217S_02415 [Streptomyces griseoloalbus]
MTGTAPVPFTADDYAARMERAARQAADAGLAGLLVAPGPDMVWLTGYTPPADTERLTLLVLAPGRPPELVVPALEAPDAGRATGAPALTLRDWTDGKDPYALTAALLDARGRFGVSDNAWRASARPSARRAAGACPPAPLPPPHSCSSTTADSAGSRSEPSAPGMSTGSHAARTRASREPSGMSAGSVPRFTATRTSPRRKASQRRSSSYATLVSARSGSVRSGWSRRTARSCRYHASIRACGSRSGSDQSRQERSRVAGSCGSGTSCSAHPCAANSRRRPSLTAFASSGSVWSVKNCHGVPAAHSSPMNSIGVNGAVSVSAAAHASSPGETSPASRSPWARLPIWSCVWL